MSNQHPLECICSHRAEPFQLRFAQQAIRFLPPRPDRSFAVSREGLIVSAETEAALAGAIEVLQNVYGDELCVGEFMIQYRRGALIEEPHMGVRVLCLASRFEAVRDDLVSRGAAISDVELVPPIGVVGGTASLARLLGYSPSPRTASVTRPRTPRGFAPRLQCRWQMTRHHCQVDPRSQ